MANKIQPVSKKEVIDYGDVSINNFWRLKQNHTVIQDNRKAINDILKSDDEGVICIQTERLNDKVLIKRIFELAQNKSVRIYILVNEYSEELNQLNEYCLIRYEVNNKGSFILRNFNLINITGTFFTGQLTEQSLAVSQHISRNIDTNEVKDLFQHFCYSFWEIAKKEIIEKGKPTDVTSKPLDVFYDVNAFNGKDFVYGTLFDFVAAVPRSEMADKKIINVDKETQFPISIKLTNTVQIGDIIAEMLSPLDVFQNQTPAFNDDGVSVKIEYQWRNVPFYLPENGSKNALYARWEKKNEEILKLLDTILEKIATAEGKEKTVSKKISRFFLGKKTVFDGLKEDIARLKQTDFSTLIEAKSKEAISRINEIHTQVQQGLAEIESEDRKAKLEDDIDRFKEEIAGREVELKSKQAELAQKEEEKVGKVDVFFQKYELDSTKINVEKNKWEQQAGKKNRESNPEEAKLADEKLAEWNQIQKADFIAKTESEIGDVQKKIKSLQSQIDQKEKEKSKAIEKTTTSSLHEVVGDKKQADSKPTTLIQPLDIQQYPSLPTVGTLFQVNSESYLAIDDWEEYEKGKKEAYRLKAKLCAAK